MQRDVFKYIRACPSCQKFKYNTVPTASPMQLHTVSQPWHMIGVDIMGPFPTTPRQKRFLLVIVGYFTRWVEMFALRNTTATDIANILINEVRTGVDIVAKMALIENFKKTVANYIYFEC